MPDRRLSSKKRILSRPAVMALGLGLAAVCGAGLFGASTAMAADLTASSNPDPGFTTGLFGQSRANLLGDMGGLRTWMGNYGVSFNLTETSEVLGNVSGGVQKGFAYDGLTTASLQVDTSKAFGWDGGTFNVSALQLHGHNLSADNLSNIQTVSGIESENATRLWELWYQQSLFDDAADVKLGQQSIDSEFMTSQSSALYLNTMMGWPTIPSYDLYGGGPAYPLSSLGARVRANASKNITILAGVFDDNPPGGPFDDDDQLRGAEKSGLQFNLNTGALIIGEIQFAVNQPSEGDMVKVGDASGLPGVYKLGFWYDTAKFPDQRYDASGTSLATSATGIAANHTGNYSIYGVVDQVIWQKDPNDPQSVSVFARPMFAPDDRNFISFSVNAGVNLKAPLPGRDDDTFGIGYGYAQVSSRAAGLDVDTNAAGTPTIKQTNEQFVEVTYQFQAAQWWQIQPDFQYIFNPGGGELNPNDATNTQRVKDEAVIGVRTNITF